LLPDPPEPGTDKEFLARIACHGRFPTSSDHLAPRKRGEEVTCYFVTKVTNLQYIQVVMLHHITI
jgi:hypothetical protein